jgi:hypothetical protein
LLVALRAAGETVGSVGEGLLHLVHGGFLGFRSDLLLSLCCGVRTDLLCMELVNILVEKSLRPVSDMLSSVCGCV